MISVLLISVRIVHGNYVTYDKQITNRFIIQTSETQEDTLPKKILTNTYTQTGRNFKTGYVGTDSRRQILTLRMKLF